MTSVPQPIFWLYTTNLAQTADCALIPFANPNSGRVKDEPSKILELRIGGNGKGAQTIFPGSFHRETGEAIEWEDDSSVVEIDGSDLKHQCSLIAACALLARNYPIPGGRHEGAFIIGAFLSRCEMAEIEIKLFVDALATATHQPPDKRRDLIRSAIDSARNQKQGVSVFGYPKLAEVFGERVAKAVVEWLGFQHRPTINGAAYDNAGERSQSAREPIMALEWFSDAADSALSEPVNPLIEDILDEGALSVIYGDSGSGKTFVTLDMGFHVGARLNWNGKKVKRGLVIYVAVEGGKRIKRRIAALKKRYREEYGDVAPDPLFALVRYQINLRSNDADLNSLLAIVRDAEKETGEKCVWLIVDTLSKAMAGGDENSPVDSEDPNGIPAKSAVVEWKPEASAPRTAVKLPPVLKTPWMH